MIAVIAPATLVGAAGHPISVGIPVSDRLPGPMVVDTTSAAEARVSRTVVP
jgi:hypothetical protein